DRQKRIRPRSQREPILAWLASPRVYGDARLCHDGGDPPSCQSAAAKKNATPNHGQNKTNAASSLIRWSIQEVRRIAIRLARKRIQPAHIIAWHSGEELTRPPLSVRISKQVGNCNANLSGGCADALVP